MKSLMNTLHLGEYSNLFYNLVEGLANAIENKVDHQKLSGGKGLVISNRDCKLVAQKCIECWNSY